MCKCTKRFKISERLQGLLCYLGQQMVFEDASEALKRVIGIDVCAPQIQRVCGYYGSAMDPLIKANCEAVIPTLDDGQRTEKPTYVMVDGSMVYTREDKWREIKLGRVFNQAHLVDIQPNRREITQSLYVSHLGDASTFCTKLERFLTPYPNKIILADGASWIWRWAEDNYPGAVQILDFYHAQEKLTLFARHQFRNDVQRDAWLKAQKLKLLDNGVEEVIDILTSLRARNSEAKEARDKAFKYYLEHDDRMQYKTYLDQGLLIGSGPIEAAHRSVIQERMKLSGQKWSVPGAQAMANLRCYKQSNAWKVVERVIAAAA